MRMSTCMHTPLHLQPAISLGTLPPPLNLPNPLHPQPAISLGTPPTPQPP